MLDSQSHYETDSTLNGAEPADLTASVRSTASGRPQFDPAQAKRFLEVLGVDPAAAWFRNIKSTPGPNRGANTRRRDPGRKGWAADLQGFDPAELAADVKAGASLYLITGNATQATGTNKETGKPTGCVQDSDVESCNALFNEWDDKPIEWQLIAWQELNLPEPTIQVFTGGKSIHSYWRLDTPMDPAEWRVLQSRLIDLTGSDDKLKNPSRLMRLPGAPYFDKATGKPTGQAAIVHESGKRYSAAKMAAALPELPQVPTVEHSTDRPNSSSTRSTTGGTLPPRDLGQIRLAAQCIPQRVVNGNTYEPSRRALCGCSAALAEIGIPDPDDVALDLLADRWPDRRTAQQVLRTSTTRDPAAFWNIAGQHGYDTRRQDLDPTDAEVLAGFREWTDAEVDELAQARERRQAQQQQQPKPEPLPQTYGELIATTLEAITAADLDAEMEARAELKHRFRVSDEQIGTALFKRHSAEKVARVAATHDSVDMARVEQLQYLMDGWILKGDLMLTYGSYGTGKTTLALAKLHAHVTGTNLLDRDTPCAPGRGLFIATDSGTGPLKKAMQDLRLDPDSSTLMTPGHPDQRIYVWGHEPGQGQSSWICDIHGVIRLEQFIKKHGITYVVIDSAKSVSSAAGWSYTSNESVAALLKYLREGVAQPHGCCIEFLSHDGTEKGSHSGAKKWAEDPSMVCSLTPAINPETNKFEGVIAEFKKDRAAHVDARRTLRFGLNDGRLELHPDVEVVSSCADAVLAILWEAHQRGVSSVSGRELKAEAVARFNRSHKTLENTLAKITGRGDGPNPSAVIRPRHGAYALSPKEIQKRTAGEGSVSNRALSFVGGISTKPTAAQGVWTPPGQTPDGGFGGLPVPPIPPVGVSMGGGQIEAHDSDLLEIPPDGGGAPPEIEPEYESQERMADTRSEKVPAAVREERDLDLLRDRQHREQMEDPGAPAPANVPSAPAWLPQALELRAANPAQPPAVLVNLLHAAGVRNLTGSKIKAALAAHDQQQQEAA